MKDKASAFMYVSIGIMLCVFIPASATTWTFENGPGDWCCHTWEDGSDCWSRYRMWSQSGYLGCLSSGGSGVLILEADRDYDIPNCTPTEELISVSWVHASNFMTIPTPGLYEVRALYGYTFDHYGWNCSFQPHTSQVTGIVRLGTQELELLDGVEDDDGDLLQGLWWASTTMWLEAGVLDDMSIVLGAGPQSGLAMLTVDELTVEPVVGVLETSFSTLKSRY